MKRGSEKKRCEMHLKDPDSWFCLSTIQVNYTLLWGMSFSNQHVKV